MQLIRFDVRKGILRGCVGVLAAAWLLGAAPAARASSTEAQVYGFAMLDMGYQKNQNDPDWFDVLRPTKLPAFDNQFGEDGHWFSGVRQSRLGVKTTTTTDRGTINTIFEFEMYGVGVDAGQTTIRLRHAFGEFGHLGFGQTWSPFMDIDVFPNSVEYWGPNGMAFFRNVQARWMHSDENTRFTIALERPGASGDAGDYADRLEVVGGLTPRFTAPDISSELRFTRGWGYVEGAGIVRYMKWDDSAATPLLDLSGDTYGWGFNLSSNIKTGDRGVIRLSVLYGEGIENYMNDAPADVAPKNAFPGEFEGKAIPVTGGVAFYDINWSDHWSTSVGYSIVDIDNTDGQAGTAFKRGQYALGNLLYYPIKNVMMGGEFQWGDRENKNGYKSEDVRFQFSARYNFSTMIGRM